MLYDDELVRAKRLDLVTQRIGFALWQLQDLEGVAAHCFVLLAQATRGMGAEAGNTLMAKALARTFGATVSKLGEAGCLSPNLQKRLRHLLTERNWLVHNSRASSRAAVHGDVALTQVVERIDRISNDALSAMKVLGATVEAHVKKYGIKGAQIDEQAAEILQAWHDGEMT